LLAGSKNTPQATPQFASKRPSSGVRHSGERGKNTHSNPSLPYLLFNVVDDTGKRLQKRALLREMDKTIKELEKLDLKKYDPVLVFYYAHRRIQLYGAYSDGRVVRFEGRAFALTDKETSTFQGYPIYFAIEGDGRLFPIRDDRFDMSTADLRFATQGKVDSRLLSLAVHENLVRFRLEPERNLIYLAGGTISGALYSLSMGGVIGDFIPFQYALLMLIVAPLGWFMALFLGGGR